MESGVAIVPSMRKHIQIKVIYWGPGESGKTTNYQQLKSLFADHLLTKGFSIETTNHRTLWNDSVHLGFPFGNDYFLEINIATATGQERFLSTREYILQNADGVIFVADSDPQKSLENIRSFEELTAYTAELDLPINIQLNKRDLDNAVKLADFRKQMQLPEFEKDAQGFPIIYEAIAAEGEGVRECFLDLIFKIIKKLLRNVSL